MMRILTIIAAAMTVLSRPAEGREYYVATNGDDANPGTREQPLATIGKAAGMLQPGDTAVIRGGTYRQTVRVTTSGRKGKPIRFVAAKGEKVILSGTEPIRSKWSLHKGRIYKTKVDLEFAQIFLDGRMMVEARWPDMRPDQILDPTTWAHAGKGSRYGKMVDPNLAKTGVDFTGALATLNVAHQFFTWTRRVAGHDKGGDTFTYDRDLPGITHYADKTRQWEDDRYYLSGKLEVLDSPHEWFLDAKTRTLYLWAPDGRSPAGRCVEAKVRDYAIDAAGADYVELRGLHFFAATFRFRKCSHCVVDGCHVRFASYSREALERAARRSATPRTQMSGSHNTIRRCSIGHASNTGLSISGAHNLVEDNVIHDVCWNGSLDHSALKLGQLGRDRPKNSGCVVRRNTLFNAGNAILHFIGQGGYVVEYNHVYNGGLCCKDVALVYTGGPWVAGSVVRYNWVHGCYTEGRHADGLRGGLGIRGDDQTRGLTVHHNVVWDCGRDGIIVKGDNNRVYNNTVLNIGTKARPGNYVNLHTAPEPKKWWRKQHPLLKVQNANSEVFNNAALTVTRDNRKRPFPAGRNNSNNFRGRELMLAGPGKLDFRPRAGSPLIDAGKVIPGFTDGYKGKAPDVGAYEHGGEFWKAGATWYEVPPRK